MTEPFVSSRSFDAPLDLVWAANSELDRMKKWWSPRGVAVTEASLDFRSGGAYRYTLCAPDGKEWRGRLTYREIVPRQKIVSVVSFIDAQDNIVRHPMAPTWPREMLSTTTFSEQDGRTTIAVSWHPINAPAEDIATFEAGRAGMEQGFAGTWENLTAYLANP